MTNRNRRVVIATGGEWSSGDDRLIEKDDFVIGVDAGNVKLLERRIPINLAVGDFDTASQERVAELRSRGVPLEQLPVDKDVTDTDFAVTKALEQEPAEVLLLGAWGSRWDHTLANVALLERLLQAGVRGVMQNRWNRMQLAQPGRVGVSKGLYTYLSLISWSETVTGIHLSGFRFPLVDATLSRTSNLAISNEWTDEVGMIHHKEGELLIIQSRDPF